MKRRLFTSLSALSLLLGLAAALLGVRSIWVVDTLIHNTRSGAWATSVRGRVGLGTQHFEVPKPISGGWYTAEAKLMSFPPNDPSWKFLGVNLVLQSNGSYRPIALFLPHWFIVGVFAILPVIWVRRWRRLRLNSRQGLCLTCGYDLRASKERCPECGTAIAPAGQASHPQSP